MARRAREPQLTRAHILQVAFEEVRTRGFQGVSLNEIIDKAGMTKGAFFHHFATKQELGYALVEEVVGQQVLDTWIAPLAGYRNPLNGILRTLKKMIDTMPPEALAVGCPLNNLTQEMSAVDPVFRTKLLSITRRWIDEIESKLRLAQQRGYLRRDCDARQLAELIVAIHEGSIGLAKSMQDKRILYSLHRSLKLHIECLSTKTAEPRGTARA